MEKFKAAVYDIALRSVALAVVTLLTAILVSCAGYKITLTPIGNQVEASAEAQADTSTLELIETRFEEYNEFNVYRLTDRPNAATFTCYIVASKLANQPPHMACP